MEPESGDNRCSQSQRHVRARRCVLLHAAAGLGREGTSRAQHATLYQLNRYSLKAFAQAMASVAQNAREISPELCAPPRLQASLTLDFARDEFTGQTVLVASRQEPPLKVVRAFAVQNGAALA